MSGFQPSNRPTNPAAPGLPHDGGSGAEPGGRPQIDAGIPRFNQGAVALLTATAFVIQWWPLVAVVLAVVAVTRLAGHRAGLFTLVYRRFVRPRVEAPVPWEWSAPPRFSQTLSVIFLAIAVALLAAGLTVAGWAVTLMVAALATLSAAARICVGCILYRQWAGR